MGNLSKLQLDDNLITSLKHPHQDVKVGGVKDQKGRRYGFYGYESGDEIVQNEAELPEEDKVLEEQRKKYINYGDEDKKIDINEILGQKKPNDNT